MIPIVHVAGEPFSRDLMEGIETTWSRLPGAAPIGDLLRNTAAEFVSERPFASIPGLLHARELMKRLTDPLATWKLQELDETVATCAALWLSASTDRGHASIGQTVRLTATAVNRSPTTIQLTGVGFPKAGHLHEPALLEPNKETTRTLDWRIPRSRPLTNPFWLEQASSGYLYTVEQERVGTAAPQPALGAEFHVRIGGHELTLIRPVLYRYVDEIYGERTRPFQVAPPVSVRMLQENALFRDVSKQEFHVELQALTAPAAGELFLELPPSWRGHPEARPFKLSRAGQLTSLTFVVEPPASASVNRISALARLAGTPVAVSSATIAYPHIPVRSIYAPAVGNLVRSDVQVHAKRVGYVMGAGDRVPAAIRQLGCDVMLLDDAQLTHGDLSQFDAIVTGIRAYNVRDSLRANQARLLDYVRQGGTLIVQYNVFEGPFVQQGVPSPIGPHPMTISRTRVSVEEAPVKFTATHPLMSWPNKITASDFDGWVQERGLYFAEKWDPAYQTPITSHDPGEAPRPGGTLYVKYGEGHYIFTAYSWFRQLPAGVPGAFRIFANFLSAGRQR